MITSALQKTFLCVPLSACAAWRAEAAEFYHVRGGIPNSQYYFRANIVGNQYLFFIGNSVLAGTGLKDANLRYSAQMVKGFKKHFPEATIIETRHSQPGGNWFGRFRCSRGQAVFGEVICSGHLAILDFAADDRGADLERVKTSLEGLVRQVILYRATHSQILVYTLTPEMLQAYQAGQTPEYIRISEQIAAHYGIPSLNLAQYAAEKIIAGEISFAEFSADGINPTDAGAKIYADAVRQFVATLLTANPVPDQPQRRTLRPPLFPDTDDNGRIVAYEDPAVQRSGNWKPGQASPIGPVGDSTSPSAETGHRSAAADARLRLAARRAHSDVHARDRHDDQQLPLPHAEGRSGREVRLLRHDRILVGVHPGERQDLRLVHGRRRPCQRPRLPDHWPPAGDLVQGVKRR